MPASAHLVTVIGELTADDPEPAVGTVLEVGSIPLPREGRTGDLLTFTRLPDGWVKQHNRSPHQENVDYDAVRFWAPLRILGIGEQYNCPQPRHLRAVTS